MSACPCFSQREYEDCCGPILGGEKAPHVESLVRARFTAFARGDMDFVESTHGAEVREDFNRAEAERMSEDCEWLGLQIHSAKETGDSGEVAFVVTVRHNGSVFHRASLSFFRREQGEWLYISHKAMPHLANLRGPKVGRNDPCPCQSGKKHKKCCGLQPEMRV